MVYIEENFIKRRGRATLMLTILEEGIILACRSVSLPILLVAQLCHASGVARFEDHKGETIHAREYHSNLYNIWVTITIHFKFIHFS